MQVGFWGYPDPEILNKIKNQYPNSEFIDLDIDFSYPKTNILPESYCKIIRNIIDNTLYCIVLLHISAKYANISTTIPAVKAR